MSCRVAVVSDDHVFSRHLLDCLDVESIGFVAGFRNTPTDRRALRSAAPDVVVIDGETSGALGLCADLTAASRTGVVMVALPADGEAAVDALAAGARGIVYATQPLTDVAKAVEGVCNGRVWAPRHVVVATWMRLKAETARQQRITEPDLAGRLSSREREVFRNAAIGLGNKELASRLSISEATVKVHLTHIFQKLGVRGRGELAAAYYGIRR